VCVCACGSERRARLSDVKQQDICNSARKALFALADRLHLIVVRGAGTPHQLRIVSYDSVVPYRDRYKTSSGCPGNFCPAPTLRKTYTEIFRCCSVFWPLFILLPVKSFSLLI
jgi:hypothetical protein